jgi:hypothetical protein
MLMFYLLSMYEFVQEPAIYASVYIFHIELYSA